MTTETPAHRDETSDRHPTQDLDDVVHQRVRLGILTVLEEAGKADFNYLATTLNLTHGNLSTHIRVLEDAGLIKLDKRIEARKPRSWLSLTPRGRAALRNELNALRALIDHLHVP
jgi:DNA-binding MarR family transcriptional regulator